MYPEDAGAGSAPPMDMGMKSKVRRNLEGLIPLILIIIIVAFLGHKFDLWTIPFLGGPEPIQVLFIGQPSTDMQVILDQDKDLVWYRVKDPAGLSVNPSEQLAQYDLVILDQHLGANLYEKSVSRVLGEGLENYVRAGGKLVVVMDSGIYRSGGIYGTSVASDVIGWKATFGDIIPVECDLGSGDMPTCTMPIAITGRVHREDFDHKIMEGIEVAPAHPGYTPLSMITFDVKPTGNQVAYLKNEITPSYYPAIVEKRLIVGKCLYFNYDPALTPGVWENTLEYLR
ncbi:MAG: hypothetical protein JW772_04595 [Candidatus Diapherotrites archaeon]|nr:hypothetical protein [Candidatus Diapherotrites archaeon]